MADNLASRLSAASAQGANIEAQMQAPMANLLAKLQEIRILGDLNPQTGLRNYNPKTAQRLDQEIAARLRQTPFMGRPQSGAHRRMTWLLGH
jgi:hypothetical protein